jgi:phosphatidylglycerophosphatase A
MAQVSFPRDVAGMFGLGRFPWAPGTAASLVAVLAGAGLLQVSPWLLAAAAVAATLIGVWAIAAAGVGGDDPTWVVIDEVAGQFLTLLALPRPTLLGVTAAFLLFRVLDIAKPGPIGWADRRSGAIAVMGDDVLAGVIGALLLLGVRWVWPAVLGLPAAR